MSYTIDNSTGDIIIKGFEEGIGENPYDGIGNLINTNIVTVPGEASVSFSTSKITQVPNSGNLTNTSASADTVTLSITGGGSTLDTRYAITFLTISDATKGISLSTVYWLSNPGGGVFNLYTDYNLTSLVNITADGLTGTWASVDMGQPKYFNHLTTPYVDCYFMVDGNGRVWSNFFTTPGNLWTFTGNSITGTNGTAHGNGLISYVPSNSGSSTLGYVFVFRDYQIDYATVTSNTGLVWTSGWKPSDGSTGNNGYLKNFSSGSLTSLSHEAFLAPDNVVYYCDAQYIGRWFELTGQAFNPTTGSPNPTTYTSDNTRLLPFTDAAQCLSFLGTSLMIGGRQNVIYPWDTTAPTFSYPILLSEFNVQKLVTVNTNMFIFVGNRGRIYYTNGTNAQIYKKIPDFLSGTVEPYYIWGGACSNKNQLYFSFSATKNSGTAITTFNGLYAIDLNTSALRLTNTLSYQTTLYNGYATALIPNFASAPAGAGLFIGWDDGSSGYGIDTTSSNPYIGNQIVNKGVVVSDLIPIGTYLKPTTNGRVEFKLSVPMVSGESVQLLYRQKFSDSFTAITGGTFNFDSSANAINYAGVCQSVNFQNSQWIQIQALLTSTTSSPSYCRLTELRLGN